MISIATLANVLALCFGLLLVPFSTASPWGLGKNVAPVEDQQEANGQLAEAAIIDDSSSALSLTNSSKPTRHGRDSTANTPQHAPVIEDITPAEGPIGTTITVHGSGFTSNNDIAFTYPHTLATQFKVGYLNNVASDDSRILTFTLPEGLGACAFSQMKEDEACISLLLPLPEGDTEISVVNRNGESNRKAFRIVPGHTPKCPPGTRPHPNGFCVIEGDCPDAFGPPWTSNACVDPRTCPNPPSCVPDVPDCTDAFACVDPRTCPNPPSCVDPTPKCPPGFQLSHRLPDGTLVCVTEGCPDGILIVPPLVSNACVDPRDYCKFVLGGLGQECRPHDPDPCSSSQKRDHRWLMRPEVCLLYQ